MSTLTDGIKQDLYRFFAIAFNAAPGVTYMNQLADAVQTGNMTVQQVVGAFTTKSEFTSVYPNFYTPTQFANKLVDTVVGTSASDAAKTQAKADIVAALNGGMSRGDVVYNIFNNLAAKAADDADWGNTSKQMANKVAVAQYYTEELLADTTNLSTLRAVIANVTPTTNVSSSAALQSVIDGSNTVTGQTFTLTTGTDAITGTAASDTINAVLQAAGEAGTTVQPGDYINGGLGTDTLNISVAGDSNGYTLAAVQAVGVEKVLLSNFDTDVNATVVAADLMSGVTTLGLSASGADGDTTFSGMNAIVAAEMRNGAADLTLTYNATPVAGSTDAQNLTVSGLTGGTFTADGIETLNITAELTKSTLAAVASNSLKKIAVAGAVDLTITGATAATTIDASAFTGKLKITSAAADQKITGGTGADTFNLVATLDSKDTIVGGDGADTITLNAAALTTQFTNVSGVETVAFNAASAAAAMDVSKLPADVTAVQLDGGDLAANNGDTAVALSISNLNGQTVTLKNTAGTSDNTGGDGVTAAITSKTDTADDSISVVLDAISGTAAYDATSAATQAATGKGIITLDVANYETVNLQSKKSDTVATNKVNSLTDTSAKALVITGDANLTITQTGVALKSVDASALVGKLDITLGANKVTVTGSAKDDTVRFAGNLDNNDIVNGGEGTADAVTATVTGLTATTGTLHMSGVETVTLDTTGANTLNLADVVGATSVSVSANTQTITGLNLATKLIATDAATLKVTAADATGTADTLTVEQKLDGNITNVIEGKGIETLSLILNDTDAGAGGLANAAVFTLSAFEGNTIKVAESASTVTSGVTVNLGAVSKYTRTIDTTGVKGTQAVDASAATAAVTFNLAGAAAATVTGTGYADTFNIASSGAVVHAITGGAGNDIANVTVKGTFVDPSGLNVETVNLTVVAGDDVTLATNKAFHATSTAITVAGGNSLSTFSNIANAGTLLAATVKTFDASAFTGNITVGVADDNLDNTVTITGGAMTTDSVTVTYATAATYAPKTVGVETLKISAGNNATAETITTDLTGTSGVVAVEINNISTTAADTAAITNITTQKVVVTGSATAGNIINPALVDASGATDSIIIELKNTGGTAIAAGTVLKIDDVETVNIKASTGDSSISLASVQITEASKYAALVVTGDKALTVSALNADINSIDASGMAEGGSFTQGARSGTTAATYIGSVGNDTFIMKAAADAIDGGAQATGGKDTLVIQQTSTANGYYVVDLSSTVDQVTTYNNSSNAAIQKGFESVDLSGITGGLGSEITAASVGSTITGTSKADTITLGAGADVVVFKSAASSDTIGSFTAAAGGDELRFDISDFSLAGGDEYVGAVGALDVDSSKEIVVLTGAGYATDEAAEDAIANRVTTNGQDVVAVYFNTTDNTAHVIYDADAGVDGTGTVVLIGQISNITTQAILDTLTTANIGSQA